MAINLSDNIKVSAPKPLDSRYLNLTGGTYLSTGATNSSIPIGERYLGLTVNIGGVEYWYKDGVLDACLIEKKYDTVIPQGDFITGATNIGYFSGKTGLQTLYIDAAGGTNDGNYHSLYNWYYVDSNAIVSIPANDNSDVTVLRRGYVRTCAPASIKSWIFSCASICSYNVGWQLVDGDIRQCVGGYLPPIAYAGPQFQETEWLYNGGIGGTGFYNSGGTLTVQVYGSLTTGSTITIGGRPYDYADHNNLHFRTIMSETPGVISVRDNDAFIYLSGKTSVLNASNVGAGAQVFSGQTPTELFFRTLRGSGDTTITTVGNEIIIRASISGQTSITGATNIGYSGGTGVFDSRDDKTLQFRNLVGSGDTTVSLSGDSVVIYTDAGEQTYNLQSPSVIPVGGICAGTVLTGKTAFELFEELLVPELFGTITAPSRSLSMIPTSGTLVEIGCLLSTICVTSSFNRGCINPQYCSVSDKRSGLPNTYIFTGTQIAGSYVCGDLSITKCVTGFTVPIGTTSWSASVSYDCGVQPLGSKGTPYCTPLSSGTTTAASGNIVGVYPLFATTSNITTLTQQGLQNMLTANNILISLVAESGGNKQKFEIPCAWLGTPTNRNLCGVCQWNTVSSAWEYPGGSAVASLTLWTPSSATETVQGNSVGYCQYTYNSVDRSAVCIRLVF